MYNVRIEFDKYHKELLSKSLPYESNGELIFEDDKGVLNHYFVNKIVSYHVSLYKG